MAAEVAARLNTQLVLVINTVNIILAPGKIFVWNMCSYDMHRVMIGKHTNNNANKYVYMYMYIESTIMFQRSAL